MMDKEENLMITLCVFTLLTLCGANDDGFNYNVKTSLERPLLPNDDVSTVIDAAERVKISQLKITPNSIAINWTFLQESLNNTHRDTVVGYISMVTDGKFISNNLGNVINEFEFKHLQPDTSYSVCVELITVNGSETVSHFKCVNMRTIPTIRMDSVVAMLITLGYLILMGVVGCTVWRHRVQKNNRNRLEEEDLDADTTVRWKDVEEKQHLNSIETNVSV